jgi:hypothetical protein
MFSPFEKYDSILKTGGKNPMFNSENGLRFFLYPVNLFPSPRSYVKKLTVVLTRRQPAPFLSSFTLRELLCSLLESGTSFVQTGSKPMG